MGYARYWSRAETPDGLFSPEPRSAYGRLAFDARAIIDAADRAVSRWPTAPPHRDGSELDARWWPEWVPARRLVVELFGPDADRCPFPP